MSLLDENIAELADLKCIIALMRNWAIRQRHYYRNNENNIKYLLEAGVKYYVYTQEEREWMEKNGIKFMYSEICPFIEFNPYVPDDMIISFLINNKDNIESGFSQPYLICKDDVIVTQLTDKVKIVKYKDIKPKKIQKFYEGNL